MTLFDAVLGDDRSRSAGLPSHATSPISWTGVPPAGTRSGPRTAAGARSRLACSRPASAGATAAERDASSGIAAPSSLPVGSARGLAAATTRRATCSASCSIGSPGSLTRPPPAATCGTRPCCACTTWVSSCATSSRPAAVPGSNAPAAKNTSSPIVNARAPIARAACPATASVCSRTRRRSAPSAASISTRSASASGRPPRRRANASAIDGSSAAASRTGSASLRKIVAAGCPAIAGSAPAYASPGSVAVDQASREPVPPAAARSAPPAAGCVASITATLCQAAAIRAGPRPNSRLTRSTPSASNRGGRSGRCRASELACGPAPASPPGELAGSVSARASARSSSLRAHRRASARTAVSRPGARWPGSRVRPRVRAPSATSAAARVTLPTSGRSGPPPAASRAAISSKRRRASSSSIRPAPSLASVHTRAHSASDRSGSRPWRAPAPIGSKRSRCRDSNPWGRIQRVIAHLSLRPKRVAIRSRSSSTTSSTTPPRHRTRSAPAGACRRPRDSVEA
jgi:hypothetical protein